MNYLKSIILVATAVSLFSCSEDEKVYTTFPAPSWKVDLSGYEDAPLWKVEQQNNVSSPAWKLDLDQHQSAPSYTLPDNHVMPASMTAVIQLTPFLESYLDAGDKLLAYIGDECRGEGVLKQVDGKNLFYLQIKAPSAETGKISFLYYSKKNNAVYQTPAEVNFEINQVYGDLENPAFPDFESVGKYSKAMQATVELPAQLPGAFGTADQVAAFVGDECRGVGSLVSGQTFSMEIRGTSAAAEKVYFKYYNAANKNIYKSEESFDLVNASNIGSTESPVMLTVVPSTHMRAVVRLSESLQAYANVEADQVSAFVGDECRGIAEAHQDAQGTYYVMQIKGLEGATEQVSFRYYSANNQYLYKTSAFLAFTSEGNYGTETAPEILPIDLAGKYPLKMHAYFTLPSNLQPYAQAGDKVAAFVGDECRAVAALQVIDGVPYVELEVIGKMEKNESFIIRYYNQRNQYMYETSAYYSFDDQSIIGSKENPECLTLINVE